MTNYNLTAIYEQINPILLISEINTLSNNYFANFILLAVFVVLWIANQNKDNAENMVFSGFVTTFVGGLMIAIEMTTFQIVILPFCLFVAGVLIKAFRE